MNSFKTIFYFLVVIFVCETFTARHHKRELIQLTSSKPQERSLFFNPMMYAMNPFINPLAMYTPFSMGGHSKTSNKIETSNGLYGMNPYMMGMMNPYMMGMNPFMMGMMNPYMMMGMMNPYMMGMMDPYMMMSYHPLNTFHPLHPYNPYNMYGAGFAHSTVTHSSDDHDHDDEHEHEEDNEERHLLDSNTDNIEDAILEQMIQEKKDAGRRLF